MTARLCHCGSPIPADAHGNRTLCDAHRYPRMAGVEVARTARGCGNVACSVVIPREAPRKKVFCTTRCRQVAHSRRWISVSRGFFQRLKAAADQRGVSMTAIVERAVKPALDGAA